MHTRRRPTLTHADVYLYGKVSLSHPPHPFVLSFRICVCWLDAMLVESVDFDCGSLAVTALARRIPIQLSHLSLSLFLQGGGRHELATVLTASHQKIERTEHIPLSWPHLQGPAENGPIARSCSVS